MPYDSTLKNLKAFRQIIFNDLVGARLVAGLDASHDSMTKFSEQIDKLSVTPYLFGRVQEYGNALQFKGLNLGTGEIRRIQGEYTGGKTLYPTAVPYKVPQRELASVDYFQYTQFTPLELLDTTNLASIRSAFMVQVPSGTFRDTPDVENAKYDYYQLYPCIRKRGRYEFTTPTPNYASWKYFEGELIGLYRDFVKAGTWTKYQYNIDAWIDCAIESVSAVIRDEPFLFWFMRPLAPAPEVVYICGTLRLPHPHKGVYTPRSGGMPWNILSFQNVCEGYGVVSDAEVYKASYEVDLGVKDELGGTTNPPPNVYLRDVFASFTVQGIPNAGYLFDHWEDEGSTISVANPYTFNVYRPHSLRAVFRVG